MSTPPAPAAARPLGLATAAFGALVACVAVRWAVVSWMYWAGAGWVARALPEVVLVGMLAVAAVVLAVLGVGVARGSFLAAGRAMTMLGAAGFVLVGAATVTSVQGVPGAGWTALAMVATLVLAVRLALLRKRMWVTEGVGAVVPGVWPADLWRSVGPEHAVLLRPYPYPVPLPATALAAHVEAIRRASGWRESVSGFVVAGACFALTVTGISGFASGSRHHRYVPPGFDVHPVGFAVVMLLEGAVIAAAALVHGPSTRTVRRHERLLRAYGHMANGGPLPERAGEPAPAAQAQRMARFTAETTALSEALTIEESTPTPHSTVSSTAHST